MSPKISKVVSSDQVLLLGAEDDRAMPFHFG